MHPDQHARAPRPGGRFQRPDRRLSGGRAQPDRACWTNTAKDRCDACIETLLDMADRHMRRLIAAVPDGTYEGHGDPRGCRPRLRRFRDQGDGHDQGRQLPYRDRFSPPQIPYFINSYEGNSYSGVYLGLMMFAQLPPPYNEGLYRCMYGRHGAQGHAVQRQVEPAPHMNCTTTPMETLTDAVRLAFEKAVPSKVSAILGPCQRAATSPAGTSATTRNM